MIKNILDQELCSSLEKVLVALAMTPLSLLLVASVILNVNWRSSPLRHSIFKLFQKKVLSIISGDWENRPWMKNCHQKGRIKEHQSGEHQEALHIVGN